MRIESKVIVSARLVTGDSIDASVSVKDKSFTEKDYLVLVDRVKKKIEKNEDVKLYYTIRAKINGEKDNWKYTDIEDVYNQLKEVFDV